MTTLFFTEHANGVLNDQSLKAISGAKEFGNDLHILIAGSNIDEAVAEASKIEGVSKVIHLNSNEFDNYLKRLGYKFKSENQEFGGYTILRNKKICFIGVIKINRV